jgi:hypothetical protein
MINQLTRTHHALSILFATAIFAVAMVLTGCGSSSSSSSSTAAGNPTSSSTTTSASTTAATSPVSCGSSTASTSNEAASTAQGDIPDNQQFLTFQNRPAAYSIKYPEGWARSGNGNDVTFQDKGNTITIQAASGSQPTAASVTAQLKQEATSDPCLQPGTAQPATVGPNQAIKVTYTTQGQKSPVTGQRPKVTVDRYVFFKEPSPAWLFDAGLARGALGTRAVVAQLGNAAIPAQLAGVEVMRLEPDDEASLQALQKRLTG